MARKRNTAGGSMRALLEVPGLVTLALILSAGANTHLHIDHCGCNDLFENAVVYAHELEEPPLGSSRISGSITLFPGVEIVSTPGHTAGSVTVFVKADRRTEFAEMQSLQERTMTPTCLRQSA